MTGIKLQTVGRCFGSRRHAGRKHRRTANLQCQSKIQTRRYCMRVLGQTSITSSLSWAELLGEFLLLEILSAACHIKSMFSFMRCEFSLAHNRPVRRRDVWRILGDLAKGRSRIWFGENPSRGRLQSCKSQKSPKNPILYLFQHSGSNQKCSRFSRLNPPHARSLRSCLFHLLKSDTRAE